jgi:hypothetical protein
MAATAATGAPRICDQLINTVVALALQLSPMSHFVRTAALRGLLLVSSLLFVVCPFLTSQTMTVSRSRAVVTDGVLDSRPFVAQAFRPANGREAALKGCATCVREDFGDGVVDLYGNDVSDAVAEYTLDAAGGLYEVHSPRTELVHLASPKT